MSDDSKGERQWVVDPPPAPGEMSLFIACGEGTELSAEQEAALGALIRTLEASDSEVVGHTKNCPKLNLCSDLKCSKVTCSLSCAGLSNVVASSGSGWNLMGSFNVVT